MSIPLTLENQTLALIGAIQRALDAMNEKLDWELELEVDFKSNDYRYDDGTFDYRNFLPEVGDALLIKITKEKTMYLKLNNNPRL